MFLYRITLGSKNRYGGLNEGDGFPRFVAFAGVKSENQ